MDKSQTLLNEARLYVKGLKASLVSRTDPAQVSIKAKTSYKALQIREALLYRATDLADASCVLFDMQNFVPAACTTRAFQETIAMLFYINRKIKKTIDDKDILALDDTLMRALVSSKNDADTRDPINILTMIDRVEKEIEGFRDVYDNLSELSHPNWAGTLGIYTKIDRDKLWVDFGKNIRLKDSTKEHIAFALRAGLELAVHIYDEFAQLLPQLVRVCDEAIESKAT
jgi:hypothetical protein